MTSKWFRKLVFDLLNAQFLSIAASFFSIILFIMFSSNFLKIIIGALTFGTLLALTYRSSWQSGSSDHNRVKINQIKYSPFKGLFACLILSGIWIIMPFINLFIKSKIINYIIMICNLYLNGFYFYFGIDNLRSVFIITLAANIIWPAVAFIAYLLGYKRISLGSKVIYKKTDKKK